MDMPYATLFVVISNVCHICHSLQDILSRNWHDLDLDLLNGPMTTVNMQIARPHATSFVGNKNVCRICHRLRDNHVRTSQYARFECFIVKAKDEGC